MAQENSAMVWMCCRGDLMEVGEVEVAACVERPGRKRFVIDTQALAVFHGQSLP